MAEPRDEIDHVANGDANVSHYTIGKKISPANRPQGEETRYEAKSMNIHHEEYLEERDDHPERVLIANPLRNRPVEEVIQRARKFRRDHGLQDVIDKGVFIRGALAARDPDAIRDIPGITRLEILALEKERDLTMWGQVKDLTRESIQILTTCCTAAIVQGWDQSSINGANLSWPRELGLPVDLTHPDSNPSNSHDVWIFGIVNAASYFSAAIIGSQLSDPLNEYAFGRRGALFIAAAFSFATVIAAAYVNSWQALLGMRILLGIGIGAKASVVAIYIAETCPTRLRGSLIILWQMFVACGIFIGDAANLVVFDSWRKQVASPFIPAIPLMVLVWFCYESPRWLYKHNKVKSALNSLRHLRKNDILACRDLFLMHEQLQGEVKFFLRKGDEEGRRPAEPPTSADAQEDAEAWDTDDDIEAEIDRPAHVKDGDRTPTWGSRLKELKNIYTPRHAKRPMEYYHIEIRNTTYFQRYRQLFVRPHIRATTAAACVMAAQQLCGVNILAFLSSTIFSDALDTSNAYGNAGLTIVNPTPDQETALADAQKRALWMSFGWGVSNFLFTFLAWGTIDRKGRRWLLNLSFPGMAITLLGLGLSFLIPKEHRDGRIAAIVTFTILYAIAYSPGAGPVPFTASAEMFPLFIRELGMSFAVFVNLFGAGIIALVTPFLAQSLTHAGLLGLFVGLNLIAWLLCYLFYPETARISLEELRAVFDVPLGAQARYRILYLHCLFRHYIIALWTKEYVEFPDPIHVWWREQPRTNEEKRAQSRLQKQERRAMREQHRLERQARKEAKRNVSAGHGVAGHAEEMRRMQDELEQSRQREAELSRQLQEFKAAQLRHRSGPEGSEAGSGGGSSSHPGVAGDHDYDHEHGE